MSLPAFDKANFEAAWNATVQMLGIEAELRENKETAQAPVLLSDIPDLIAIVGEPFTYDAGSHFEIHWIHRITAVHCGMQKPRATDVVNAYEERDWIVTLRAMDLTTKPVKFDVIIADGREFAISKVKEIYINQTLMGWKAIVSG